MCDGEASEYLSLLTGGTQNTGHPPALCQGYSLEHAQLASPRLKII